MILGIRTDKPESELWLATPEGEIIEIYKWEAHRRLAETIHFKIEDLLKRHNLKLENLSLIAGYLGPGSFTGLRIGLTVANGLAYGLSLSSVGSVGEEWFENCINQINEKSYDPLIPEYGGEVFITAPKK